MHHVMTLQEYIPTDQLCSLFSSKTLVETRVLDGEEAEKKSVLSHEAVKSVSGPITCDRALIAIYPI